MNKLTFLEGSLRSLVNSVMVYCANIAARVHTVLYR
jgi:hypothetical protein